MNKLLSKMFPFPKTFLMTVKLIMKLDLVIILLVLIAKDSSADVPICTHDTMGDHAFCFPPEYNKVIERKFTSKFIFNILVLKQMTQYFNLKSLKFLIDH